jgi:hypothetical protein
MLLSSMRLNWFNLKYWKILRLKVLRNRGALRLIKYVYKKNKKNNIKYEAK